MIYLHVIMTSPEIEPHIRKPTLDELKEHILQNYKPHYGPITIQELEAVFEKVYTKAVTHNFDFNYDGIHRTLHDVASEMLILYGD